ncbi:MAG: 50S ribosomal protein L13 [Bullifex sp.]|nr:50S ribosomal protein L13 [Spirochaetales bacterium]MDY2816664.1 50S ribosomal protein L13 [Bullifex sp.]MDD7007831.1 50S ribosomal protein L13 [Spirochaetales bacterium]MDD7535719.1 50S ribosomal protein L13 [Spirochaetales bacterium]MDY3850258.1 50S ribosomal protein L13 [Bullifex sp.]
MKTIFVKPQSVEKKWYLIDAEGKNLGRVAVAAARILRGKNKPEYVPHQDMGDNVIIINAAKASVTGNKVIDKKYYRHSMFPGGLTTESYGELIERKPTFPMEHAIKGMLPHGKLGRALFTNLRVYAGAEHPHMAQQPIVVEL